MSSPFPGPIAPESNPPINPQYYQPRRFVISNIALGTTTLVTTSVNHDYVIGQEVKLLIPFPYGSTELNQQFGNVILIPALNQVVVTINSTRASTFIPTPTFGLTQAQIIAIGDVNSGQINLGRTGNLTFIPGSFIDISPA